MPERGAAAATAADAAHREAEWDEQLFPQREQSPPQPPPRRQERRAKKSQTPSSSRINTSIGASSHTTVSASRYTIRETIQAITHWPSETPAAFQPEPSSRLTAEMAATQGV